MAGRPTSLNPLQDVLAALYPTEEAIAQLLGQAGVDTSWLDLDGSPASMWFDTLTGLHQRREVRDVVTRAGQEIPGRADELDSFLADYEADIGVGGKVKEKSGAGATASVRDDKATLLFWAANPLDTDELWLGREQSKIKERIREGEYRDAFNLESQFSVQVEDLSGSLLEYQPSIVHFAGHANDDLILLEDRDRQSQRVSNEAIANLFGVMKQSARVGDRLRCVVFNACYSSTLAEAVAEHVDCVVGTSTAIGDKAATSFAAGFYRGLAFGESVAVAFQLGCNEIDLVNLDEELTPQLHVKEGIDAGSVNFAGG
jgi:hypothetical protein